MNAIATVEDAILAAVTNALGNTLRQTDSLGGGWTMEALRRALQFAPGVYVAFIGMQPGQGRRFYDGRFTVYTVTKGAHDHDRRRGKGNAIGAYDILAVLVPRLDGLSIDDVGSTHVRGVENLFREAMFELGGTVYGIQLNIPNMKFGDWADASALADFATFSATHEIGDADTMDTETLQNIPTE